MEWFIILLVCLAVVAALPTDYELRSNRTLRNNSPVGFASWGSGTYGGTGGASFTVWDPWAFVEAIQPDTPRAVYVRGRIDLTALFTGSPGVSIRMGSFKHIIGGDANAEIFGGGISMYQRQQVIIRNLKFTNALNYAPGEQPNGQGGIISMVPGAFSVFDNIDIDGSEFVWVDHCEFSDDPWIAVNTPADQRRHHGLMGIKRAASMITISNNIYRNHNLNIIIGHSDDNAAQDVGRLMVTFYGNWFQGTIQRNPMIRYGVVHIFNNLYTDISDYGIGINVGSRIYAERNVFINVYRSWGLMAVNQWPEGYLLNVDNWLLSGSTIDANVPSNVGWNPSSYYSYTPLATGNVEASVRNNAGMWM